DEPGDPADSFIRAEAAARSDTGWQSSLDAVEVEVTVEGDVDSAAADLERAPLSVGQFALTYLRTHARVYLQSLAEDYAHGADRIEWLVGSEWLTLLSR